MAGALDKETLSPYASGTFPVFSENLAALNGRNSTQLVTQG